MRSRANRLVLTIAGVAAAIALVGTTGDTKAAPIHPMIAPRGQRVVMFTDSVGLGAEFALPKAFPADWQVRVDGRPAEMVGEMEQNFVRPRLRTNPDWFGDHVVIAAAYNAPYWDWARLDREIDSIISTLTAAGVKHVYWVTLREIKPQYISAGAWRQIQPYYWYFPTVNDHLEAALERHPNLTLVDFAAAADRSGITYDAIHLNTTGAALYSGLIRQAVDGAATRVPDGSTTRIHVPGGENAAAAAINIATTDPRTIGYLTTHPCGAVPNVSMHNYARAQIVAHSTIVALDPGGDFCVTTRAATNLVVDVTGLFTRGGDLAAITPSRWLDTRDRPGRVPVQSGEVVELDIDDIRVAAGVTGTPKAVAIGATATEAVGPGFLRVVTCGSDAETSNVNYLDASPSPNNVIVELDDQGRICVMARTTTHVIIDLFAVFGADASVGARGAVRLFDSRAGSRVEAGSVTRLSVADAGVGPDAAGVVMNLTALETTAPGFVTAYPCADGRPESSSLNMTGSVVSNAAIVAPDANGDICVYTLTATQLVVDVLGEIGDSFAGFTPIRVLDTRS